MNNIICEYCGRGSKETEEAAVAVLENSSVMAAANLQVQLRALEKKYQDLEVRCHDLEAEYLNSRFQILTSSAEIDFLNRVSIRDTATGQYLEVALPLNEKPDTSYTTHYLYYQNGWIRDAINKIRSKTL